MAGNVHKLIVLKEVPGNFSQYKYYAECVCGFQCRVGTEAAAKSQFDNHLLANGAEEYFAKGGIVNKDGSVKAAQPFSPTKEQPQQPAPLKPADSKTAASWGTGTK
jgi:hypothetical protein